jgi:CheY-like chemotaxis protein/two-component sensor histidine kinase
MDIDGKKKFRIFIVDDVPGNIQLAANILKKSNYDFFYAENGKKALSIAKEKDFDLILLDIMMPEMDGYQVCEELKKNPGTRDIPIIFLTAKADKESIVKGLGAGAVDYVTKPFNDAELVARVKTHLALREAQKNLREANATKDKFFSIIAHDLKNPFNSLIGLSELLIKNFDNFDDVKKKKFIQKIYESSDNMYKLLENLLSWSRMQTGRIEWCPENINLNQIAGENLSLLKTAAENKHIVIISDLNANTTVYADADMVTMVFRNLITNAIKFTREDGVVRIVSKITSNFEEITVSDTGLGLSKEDIKKLFKIDVQHSTCGTAKEKGSGLGLILCKEFIEKNGGKIWVESELGKGSDFKFTLPKTKNLLAGTIKDSGAIIDNTQIKKDKPHECFESNRLQKIVFPLRMLLVDDDDDNHIIVKHFLKNLPIQLDIAENGVIAVDKFKSGHYDLVLMDMQMPVLDGYAAVREIRSFEEKTGEKETPVIALSAYSTKEEMQLSMDGGCNDHLSKPIRQDELISMISKYGKPSADE